MVVRDFSHAAAAEIADTIKRNLDDLDHPDWVEHVLSQHPGSLPAGLGPIYADVAYHEAIIEDYRQELRALHHSAQAHLTQVWSAVYDVEARFAPQFQQALERQQSFNEEMRALAALVVPDGMGSMPLFTLSKDELWGYFATNMVDNERFYDFWLQGQVLALLDDPEFSQAVWDSLDEAGRQDFLNRLLARVQEILGTGAVPEIFFSPVASSDDYLAQYKAGSNQIVFYPALMGDSLEFIMMSIFHETRHAYQWEAVLDYWANTRDDLENTSFNPHIKDSDIILLQLAPGERATLRHPYVSGTTAAAWKDNYENPVPPNLSSPNATASTEAEQYRLYLSSPIEFDAWSFSGQLEYETSKPWWERNGTFFNLIPSYQGSWDVPKKD